MSTNQSKGSLVVACDVDTRSAFENLITQTGELDFVSGFKIGAHLALSVGLVDVCEFIGRYAGKHVIYDHQKFGTDIPDICGGALLELIKKGGVTHLIAFPFAGIQTLRSFVDGCRRVGLTPIVGGEMTHGGFLVSEEGYIADDSPSRMYRDAASLGVDKFVVPATKPDRMGEYRSEIEQHCGSPTFLFPGVGKGQGGDIVAAFRQIAPHPGIAIVGRSIYAQPNPGAAAEELWLKVGAGLGSGPVV